jgi:anti-sigma regulatory factor (Ser/Thr protein kinase)
MIADRRTNARTNPPKRPEFNIRLTATPGASSELRHSLRSWLEALGVSDREAFDVTLACAEAFANAIGRPDGQVSPVVEVAAVVRPSRVLTIVVRNRSGRRRERSLEEARVFLRLMESLMDSAETYARTDGVTLVLRKRLGVGRPPLPVV